MEPAIQPPSEANTQQNIEILDSQEPTQSEETPSVMTLSDYVEENQKVYSVLSVFTALTVLSFNIKPEILSAVTSTIFLGLTVLLLFDVWETRYPPRDAISLRLEIFLTFLFLAILNLFIFWYFKFRNPFWFLDFFIIWLPLLGIFWWLNTKYGWTDHITPPHKKGKLSSGGQFALLFVVGMLTVCVAYEGMKPLTTALNAISGSFEAEMQKQEEKLKAKRESEARITPTPKPRPKLAPKPTLQPKNPTTSKRPR